MQLMPCAGAVNFACAPTVTTDAWWLRLAIMVQAFPRRYFLTSLSRSLLPRELEKEQDSAWTLYSELCGSTEAMFRSPRNPATHVFESGFRCPILLPDDPAFSSPP